MVLDNVISDLKEQRTDFLKTIIFCQKHTDCANMYQKVRASMLAEFTELPGYPSFLQQFRLADMYHTAMTVNLKEKVLQSFCTVNGKLQLLVATTAFGLDIDCPDIRRVYHWGLLSNLDSYVQESGRQGEISNKVTQSCGMGMCQSIPNHTHQLLQKNQTGTSFTSLSHSRSHMNSAKHHGSIPSGQLLDLPLGTLCQLNSHYLLMVHRKQDLVSLILHSRARLCCSCRPMRTRDTSTTAFPLHALQVAFGKVFALRTLKCKPVYGL